MMSTSGTSLAQARELYNVLQESSRLMDQIETQGQQTTVSMTRLLSVTNSVLIALGRLDLGEENEEVTRNIKLLISLLIQAHSLILTLNLALAMGPAGWVIGGIGLVTSAVSMANMAGSLI